MALEAGTWAKVRIVTANAGSVWLADGLAINFSCTNTSS